MLFYNIHKKLQITNKDRRDEKVKQITLKISMTLSGLSEGKEFLLNLNDDATIVDALAAADKYIYEHPEGSIFPIFNGYIHNYLQLFWNPEENKIYDDVGLIPYGPDEKGALRKFMPLRDEVNFNLYPNSVIELQLDPGC